VIRLGIAVAAALALVAAVQQVKPPKPTESPKPTPSASATPDTTPPATPGATPPVTPEAPKAESETHAVEKGTLTLTFDADGTFEAIEPYELKLKFEAFQGDLTIQAIAANGATVKKGDEVLRIDAPALKQQLEATQVELTAAQALLAKSEKDQATGAKMDGLMLSIQRRTLSLAEAGLKWWKDQDGRQMIDGANLYVKRVQDAIDDQSEELEQLKKMYKSEELTNATSEIVVKRAERVLAMIKDYYQKWAKEELKKVSDFLHPETEEQLKNSIEQARLQVEQLEYMTLFQRSGREAELARAKAGVEQQKDHLGKLKKDAEQLSAKSTLDGTVLYGGLQAGAWVGHEPKTFKVGEKTMAGQVLLTVFTPGRLKVKTDLPESQRFWIKAGMKAQVTPSAAPEAPIEGKCGDISFITAMKGPAPSFDLTVDVAPVDARFVPGMKASIHIDVADVKDALLVPVSALQRNKVFVRGKDGKDEPRVVVAGRSDGKMVEILKGVGVGDAVVTQPK